jgi:glucosamine-6-phosphate deaminase
MKIPTYLTLKGPELLHGPLPIDIYPDKEAAFAHMAQEYVDVILANKKAHKKTLIITPLGPVGQYKYFVKMVNEQRIDLHDVTFLNMDEYMADESHLISPDDPISFHHIMYELCYNKIDPSLIMPVSQRIFPTPNNGGYIDAVIAAHGGVDCCFGGIGITGHLAFNEPPEPGESISEKEFLNSSVRVQLISRETRVVNSFDDFHGAYDIMPKYCVTIGLKQILNSKSIRVYVFRDWHKAVLRKAAFGPVSIAFPASYLQKHHDARLGITAELAE